MVKIIVLINIKIAHAYGILLCLTIWNIYVIYNVQTGVTSYLLKRLLSSVFKTFKIPFSSSFLKIHRTSSLFKANFKHYFTTFIKQLKEKSKLFSRLK